MISYYSHRKDGLPCCLRAVCVRPAVIQPIQSSPNRTAAKTKTTIIKDDEESEAHGIKSLLKLPGFKNSANLTRS